MSHLLREKRRMPATHARVTAHAPGACPRWVKSGMILGATTWSQAPAAIGSAWTVVRRRSEFSDSHEPANTYAGVNLPTRFKY